MEIVMQGNALQIYDGIIKKYLVIFQIKKFLFITA